MNERPVVAGVLGTGASVAACGENGAWRPPPVCCSRSTWVVWQCAIRDVGAGVATVLGNLQVVIVPFVALAVLGERVPRAILYALRLVCTGVLFEMSLVTLSGGLAIGVDDLAPVWPSALWLVTPALTSQVLGWLLITVSLPRLPAAITSMILTAQPVAAGALGAILLGQEPSVLQLCGVALIFSGLVSVAVRRGEPARAAG